MGTIQINWIAIPACLCLVSPVAAQSVIWNGTSDDWFAGANWSSGTVPAPTDDVGVNTGGFATPRIDLPGAVAGRLSVGGFPNDGSGSATTGFGRLEITDGGQLVNGAGSAFDTFVGIGNDSDGGVTVTGPGSNWTTTDFVVVGASGSTGTLQVADDSTANFGALFVGISLEDAIGLTFGNDSEPSVGTLDVTGGAVLAADFFANVGVGRDATGVINVSGAGSALSSDGGVLVGILGGTGTFNVVNGGTLATGPNGPFRSSVIGGGGPSNMGMGPPINGGIGNALISGAGSTWTNGGGLFIGGFLDTETGAVYPGTGTLTIADGGRITSSGGGDSGLPDVVGIGETSLGTAVVTGAGSGWTATQNLAVGFAGGTGSITVEDEGAIDVSGVFGVGIGLTDQPGGNGTVNVLSGGTLTSNSGIADDVTGGLVGAGGAAGSVLISGGGSSWVVDGRIFVGGQPDFDLSPGTGTIRVEAGGNLTASGGIALATEAGSFGTLTVGAEPGRPATAPGTLDVPGITFGAGTSVLNFNHSAAFYEFAPVISGPGAINQIAGTTVLTGDSLDFDGTTTVSGGRLNVGADGTVRLGGVVDVNSGGTLGGTGVVGGLVNVADGATVSPGTSPGTLTVGALTLSDGSILDYELGTPTAVPGSADDRIVVAGDLVLDGTLNVTDIGGFGAGFYRLIDYGGTLTDNGLEIGTTPAGVTASDLSVQTGVPAQVNLISSAGAELSFWDGGNLVLHDDGTVDGGSGVWNAANRNWTGSAGAVNGAYRPNPSFAVFQGAGGTVTVDNGAGAIAVTGMQFASDGYFVTGDALTLAEAETIVRVGDGTAGAGIGATIASSLIGTGGLTKTDFDTLVLTGANSYSGGTHVETGTLQVGNGGTAGNLGTGDIVNDAVLVFNRSDAHTVVNAVSGTGTLTQAGTGTLTLTGTNSYTGGTRVETGTLVGDAGAIAGDLSNAGTVVFDQTGDAGFAGDIAGLDGTDGTMVKRGAGRLTLAGASTLDWSVDAGELVSSAQRFAGDVAIGSAGRFTLDKGTEGLYAGSVSGTGTFAKTGAGTLDLAGDSAIFAGTTDVQGGTLLVNGSLGGMVNVATGAVLGGTGTIGSLTASGTVAPGNSIGTLDVAGDLTFTAGSVYEVEVDPAGTDSDLIAVGGTGTLQGGTVRHIGSTGLYGPTSTYTILTAAGGVTGTFDTVASDFVFLDARLDYGANAVNLTLERSDISFADIGLTANQTATAGAVESLDFGNAVFDAVVQLDARSARNAFDQLSGEGHASLKTALIDQSRFLREAVNDRLRAAMSDLGGAPGPALSPSGALLGYGPAGAGSDSFAALERSAAGAAGWSRVFGTFGEVDSDGNAAGLDHNTGGFLAGVDGLIAERVRLGLMAGYSTSSVKVDDRAFSADADTYHIGIYGGTEISGFALRGGAAYSWHDIETERSVAFPGFADSLETDADARTLQVFGEAGYGFDAGAIALEPFAGIAHVNLDTDAFAETGGAAALTSGGNDTAVTFSTVGLRAATQIDLAGMAVRLHGTAGWRHSFGDRTPMSTHAFAGGTPFAVAGVPVAEDAAIVEAGIDFDITTDATLAISYDGQFAKDTTSHGAKLDFKLRF